MINAYVYASCTSCRKSEAVLLQSGAAWQSRDFFKDRFTGDELATMLDRAGLTPSDVLSRRSKVYKARRTELEGLASDALLDLMIEEPTLLRRPVVVGDGRVVVGHNAGKLAELIALSGQ